MKFGGTSVNGPEQLKRVAAIVVQRAAEDPVVVTSAMAGVTNELATLLETARSGNRESLEHWMEDLAHRHLTAGEGVAPGDRELAERLDHHLRDLRVLLRGARLLGTASERASDQVLGFGELLAQELLVAALRGAGAQALLIDAREVVITDDRFGAARPDPELTRRRCLEKIIPIRRSGVIPVLGGYLGATPEGIPTTLGRGGSDLSAAVIGVALDAAGVEIWTDVDGLMSADPRVVAQARLLDKVTFREAAELAGFGAKVLHPASIDPAIQGGIPVLVRNSLDPSRPGTWIGPAESGQSPVRATVCCPGLDLLAIRAPGWRSHPGFLSRLLEGLETENLTPAGIFPGAVFLELLLPASPRATSILTSFGGVERVEGLTLVVVVGEGLAERPDLWAEILACAAPSKPRRLGQGPRGSSLMLLVDEKEAANLVQRLHRRFIEEQRPPWCG